MSGHELPSVAEQVLDYALGEPQRVAPTGEPVGLGARYVAVKYSAAYHEARADAWRTRALVAMGLAVVSILALALVVFSG